MLAVSVTMSSFTLIRSIQRDGTAVWTRNPDSFFSLLMPHTGARPPATSADRQAGSFLEKLWVSRFSEVPSQDRRLPLLFGPGRKHGPVTCGNQLSLSVSKSAETASPSSLFVLALNPKAATSDKPLGKMRERDGKLRHVFSH